MPAPVTGGKDGAWRRPLAAVGVVLVMLAGLIFQARLVSGPTVPLLTESGVGSVVRDLPCPSGTQAIQQLSGRIPVGQYAGTGNERYAAALRDVFIDGVHVKSCRAPRPTGKWQTAYHVAVIQGESYKPEYGPQALAGVINLHKAKLQNAQETRLESPGGPSAPEVQAAAVIGRFIRPGGDVDNIHLYHFVHGNAVAWILFQAVSPLLPLTTVPDPESWRVFQEMFARLRDVAPAPPPLLGLSLPPCSLTMADFYTGEAATVGEAVAWLISDEAPLRRPDLRNWNTGQVVPPADYAKGLDIKYATFSISGNLMKFDFEFANLPSQLPGATIGVVLDLPNESGVRNAYTGDIEWDRGIQARWVGPGRWEVLGGPYLREQPIAGATVQESRNRVALTVPLRAAREMGLAIPGVKLIFGSYGPMPDRVYDTIPERGAFQIGVSGQMNWREVVKIAPYAFGNVTGGDAIQGVTLDRNNNGRIEFQLGEGPWFFPVRGEYVTLGRPQSTEQGRARISRFDSQAAMLGLRLEDRNNDGDFNDDGEDQWGFVPKVQFNF